MRCCRRMTMAARRLHTHGSRKADTQCAATAAYLKVSHARAAATMTKPSPHSSMCERSTQSIQASGGQPATGRTLLHRTASQEARRPTSAAVASSTDAPLSSRLATVPHGRHTAWMARVAPASDPGRTCGCARRPVGRPRAALSAELALTAGSYTTSLTSRNAAHPPPDHPSLFGAWSWRPVAARPGQAAEARAAFPRARSQSTTPLPRPTREWGCPGGCRRE